ncbi:MAG: hypothetical protein AB7P99_13970 [Vicinamibacterales bacterium]
MSGGVPVPPVAGWHDGVLYCYGGCGTRYCDFAKDVVLPTPLWNRIAVGLPFDESQTNVDREGRGGVLCPACIIARLAALPDCTAILADIRSSAAPVLLERCCPECGVRGCTVEHVGEWPKEWSERIACVVVIALFVGLAVCVAGMVVELLVRLVTWLLR